MGPEFEAAARATELAAQQASTALSLPHFPGAVQTMPGPGEEVAKPVPPLPA